MNPKYKEKNAIKHLYNGIYELDKSFDFKYPRLKPDMEKYLSEVMNLLDESFNIAGVNKVIGHEIKSKSEDTDAS